MKKDDIVLEQNKKEKEKVLHKIKKRNNNHCKVKKKNIQVKHYEFSQNMFSTLLDKINPKTSW